MADSSTLEGHATPQARPQRKAATIDNWLETRPNLIPAIIVAAAFLLRLWIARGTFLNPDEALHFRAANTTSWWLTYQRSLGIAHPPLLVFLLHFWRVFGMSELVLRLPSVIAGTLFCWIFYRWVANSFSRTAAWISLIFVSFLPPMVELSAELRHYALLLVFCAGALYFFDKALSRNSAWQMVVSLLCLYLALLSHYSAVLFAAWLGIYALVRLRSSHPSARVLITWSAGQVGALGICRFLYVVYISGLSRAFSGSNVLHGFMQDAYLLNSYFQPHRDNALLFIFARTGGVFQFLFGQLVVGDLMFPLFVAGIALLMRSRPDHPTSMSTPRQLGFLLVLPFVINCAVALAGIYPYGGTRHSVFLAMFAIAAIGVALAKIVRENNVYAITAALVIVIISNLFGTPHRPYIPRADQKIAHMNQAIAFINSGIPNSQPIFADNQAALMLGHYLCHERPVPFDRTIPGFLTFLCDAHNVIATEGSTNRFTAENFFPKWNEMLGTHDLKSGEAVWVVQMGWDIGLARELQTKFPQYRDLDVHYFGRNITMFKLIVDKQGSLPRSP
ncbi:MAG TPA: glycosyltransferase family 39 protein [Terriglobales bacterium]|nr:glycosyltransferase family 39 protein [Terriglobales bacterium]